MSQPPPPPRPRDVHVGRLLAGVLLLLFGIGWMLEALDVANVPWDVLLPIALVVIGGLVLWNARAGRGSGGLVALGIVLTVVLATGTVVSVPLEGGVGDRTYHPRSFDGLHDEYKLGIGHLVLDLSDLTFDPTTVPALRTVHVRVGIGQLVVRTSEHALVDIRAHAGIGQVDVFGHENGGFSVDGGFHPRVPPGSPVLSLVLSVGIGQVQVTRG